MTCTSLRFSLYENGKHLEILENSNSMLNKLYVASFAGIVGSLVGLPMDVINVRMQNDMKYDEHLRRKYIFDVQTLLMHIRTLILSKLS